jgi:hypothetical protein
LEGIWKTTANCFHKQAVQFYIPFAFCSEAVPHKVVEQCFGIKSDTN